jgi:hypothetical protein
MKGTTVASLRPSEDVVLTELKDGTGVLLHLGTRHYFTLNATGVVAWKLIADGRLADGDAVAARIAGRFPGVDPSTVRTDVAALLAELEAEGLLAPAS